MLARPVELDDASPYAAGSAWEHPWEHHVALSGIFGCLTHETKPFPHNQALKEGPYGIRTLCSDSLVARW